MKNYLRLLYASMYMIKEIDDSQTAIYVIKENDNSQEVTDDLQEYSSIRIDNIQINSQ